MKLFRLMLATAILLPSTAAAAPILTFGVGSAVTTVDASADFESFNALFDNPYIENGLSFFRTDLSPNNNGCGYAGCGYHPGFYPPFTGNYLYGVGSGYFSIQAAAGQYFTGLEFLSGTGFGTGTIETLVWSAYRQGTLVGNGTATVSGVVALGFSDAFGFDTLQYTRQSFGFGAPALDTVTAQYAKQIPELSSFWLLGIGVGSAVVHMRRRVGGSRV